MNDDQIRKFIKKINAECADGSYIFRGTREICEDNGTEYGISSTLYRKYDEPNPCKKCEELNLSRKDEEPKREWKENFKPADAEKEIIGILKARVTAYSQYTNIEILTDLRHHGGKVTLIDFSLNVYTALFFACNGEFEKDGELIMLERSEIPHINDVNYDNPIFSVINPAPTKTGHKRAMSQNSIFVHAPSGFISKNEKIVKTKTIKSDDKKSILVYLEEHHKISQNSVYNDLMGFIDNEENYASSRDKFYDGLLHYINEEFDEAIQAHSDAIDLDPNFAEAYFGRGISRSAEEFIDEAVQGAVQGAIQEVAREATKKATKEVVEEAVKKAMKEVTEEVTEEAMKEVTEDATEETIKKTIKKAIIKAGRETTEEVLKEAIEDFTKAIARNSNFAEAYVSRGGARYEIGDNKGAIKDLEEAIKIDSSLEEKFRPLINEAKEKLKKATEEEERIAR